MMEVMWLWRKPQPIILPFLGENFQNKGEILSFKRQKLRDGPE